MGYGPKKNGKYTPISSWKGSWAEQEERRRDKSGDKSTKETRRSEQHASLERKRTY